MSEPNSTGAVIEGDYMEVDGDGKPVNPQAQPGAAQPGANDNRAQDSAESVEERLRIKKYDELDPERQAEVDAIIETINIFDLDSIVAFGDEPIDKCNGVIEQLTREQDEHDKDDGILAEFSAITGVTEESATSKVFRSAMRHAENAKAVVIDTVKSVKENLGIMARIGGMLLHPLVVASNKFQEWKDGEEGKTKEKKKGVRAIEYADEKERREEDFRNRFTIPQELKDDILEAAAKENEQKTKIEKILKAIPKLRATFSGLVRELVIVFDAMENYIIAGEEGIRIIRETVLPEAEEEARRIGTQAKRLEVNSIRSGLDILAEGVFTLQNFRYNAMMGAVAFEQRNADLGRIQASCNARLKASKAALTSLAGLRGSLTVGRMEEIIAEARQGEIRRIDQDTALNLVMVDFHKNSVGSTADLVAALERNLLSKKRLTVANSERATRTRVELEEGREKMENLTRDAARLAAPTEENIVRMIQEIAEADAIAAGEKSHLALDWSARQQGPATGQATGQALTPVKRLNLRDKMKPKTP